MVLIVANGAAYELAPELFSRLGAESSPLTTSLTVEYQS